MLDSALDTMSLPLLLPPVPMLLLPLPPAGGIGTPTTARCPSRTRKRMAPARCDQTLTVSLCSAKTDLTAPPQDARPR